MPFSSVDRTKWSCRLVSTHFVFMTSGKFAAKYCHFYCVVGIFRFLWLMNMFILNILLFRFWLLYVRQSVCFSINKVNVNFWFEYCRWSLKKRCLWHWTLLVTDVFWLNVYFLLFNFCKIYFILMHSESKCYTLLTDRNKIWYSALFYKANATYFILTMITPIFSTFVHKLIGWLVFMINQTNI